MADLVGLVLNRRSPSPRRLAEPVPNQSELALLMQAAAAAPDHKALRPVRFLLIPASRRAELATAFGDAKRERDPGASDEEVARAAAKAFNGPMLIAVVLRLVRDHPRVSVNDQVMSAGAAVENVLLAASALGFAGCLRSGISATSRRVREALSLGSEEEIAAFLILGTPSRPLDPRPPADVADLLTVWS